MFSRKKKPEISSPPENTLLTQLYAAIATWPSTSDINHDEKHIFINELLQGGSLHDLQKSPRDEVIETMRRLWEKFQQRKYADIHIDIQEDSFGEADRVDITLIQRQIPFVTDSLLNLLRHSHLSVRAMLNAAIKTRRDDEGVLLSIHDDNDLGPDLQTDKVFHLQCDHRGEELNVARLRSDISDVLRDVHAAVEDWRGMRAQMVETISELDDSVQAVDHDEAHEAAQFLTFLNEGDFTLLGYREHNLRREKEVTFFDTIQEKSLGVLRDAQFLLFDGLISDDLIPRSVSEFIAAPQPLMMVLKANRRSTVHRGVHMDVVIVKRLDAKGRVEALRLFAGLFTAQCYARSAASIPYLQRKVNAVLQRAGYDPDTHPWRALRHVLDTYPRDELFQISSDELYDTATGIYRLNNRPAVDVFVRKDPLQRFFSVLFYVPKDIYDTQLRLRAQSILEQELQGEWVANYMTVDENALARLHFMIAPTTTLLPAFNLDRIRERLVEISTPWFDRLKTAALGRFGKFQTQVLLRSLGQAFSVSYCDQVRIDHALDDLTHLQNVMRMREMVVTLAHYADDADDIFRVKIYRRNEEMLLADMLPILEKLGFRCLHEYAYHIKPSDGLPSVWINEMVGTIAGLQIQSLPVVAPLFADAFEAVWNKAVESDSFNCLISLAMLTWREANIFRALARYLDLSHYAVGRRYMAQVLMKYPRLTQQLRTIFLLRHDPHQPREEADALAEQEQAAFITGLEEVEKLDEDRVLRSMLNLIVQTLRTNYFQLDDGGHAPSDMIFKFNAAEIPELPLPRPYREIFLYSPRVESVHLRGGPIARGGIRWSDRYEDFRTEILGLVKAQMVKNAVIVPVGAKGGFVCKRQPGLKTPQERQQEGVACYQIMIRGLLSVTDNLVNDEIVPPHNVVRRDGDDPYLVVAADKGTATFSDIANKISLDHGFWLGDAFASGGSKGYDHKAMGITARGAWECIKRHFRELGTDIQTQAFTVAGVGDMSGDVFGNGLLLSQQTRLVAAFDHRHIFIDPSPDAAKSFAERKRLFEKPTSSWMDYNAALLSKGGQIISRQDKTVTLTPEARVLLGITIERPSPNDVMQAILRAPVDLLYFGGIGTYIKASVQTNEQVGDKGNDAMRVDANTLRCKVIGEGANLATTQAARIEYAHGGGKINTDFIDNAGGVDTSDHEVNLKILLQPLVQANKLTEADRDILLSSMTEEVGQHVLKNNYDQSLALSLVARRAAEDISLHRQLMRKLEREGLLDRNIEGLPHDEELQLLMNRHEGLTRPELAILMAYAKMNLFTQLMNTQLPDDPAVLYQAYEYFPEAIKTRFASDVPRHKLKRDIISTEIANVIVNRMGPTYVVTEEERIGVDAAAVAKAWLTTRNIFDLRARWNAIDGLDNKISADAQMQMYEHIVTLLRDVGRWFIRRFGADLVSEDITPIYKDGLAKLLPILQHVMPASLEKAIAQRREQMDNIVDLNESDRQLFAYLPMMRSCCDVIDLQAETKADLKDVALVYFNLSALLHVVEIQEKMAQLPADDAWTQEAVDALSATTLRVLIQLTRQFFASKTPVDQLEAWLAPYQAALQATGSLLEDISRAGVVDLAQLTVLVSRLQRLVG